MKGILYSLTALNSYYRSFWRGEWRPASPSELHPIRDEETLFWLELSCFKREKGPKEVKRLLTAAGCSARIIKKWWRRDGMLPQAALAYEGVCQARAPGGKTIFEVRVLRHTLESIADAAGTRRYSFFNGGVELLATNPDEGAARQFVNGLVRAAGDRPRSERAWREDEGVRYEAAILEAVLASRYSYTRGELSEAVRGGWYAPYVPPFWRGKEVTGESWRDGKDVFLTVKFRKPLLLGGGTVTLHVPWRGEREKTLLEGRARLGVVKKLEEVIAERVAAAIPEQRGARLSN